MSKEAIRRSVPISVTDGGVWEKHGLRKWDVVMEDGTKGVCWTVALDDQGEPRPCPFVKGRKCAYTTAQTSGALKLRPLDLQEVDKQRIISRQAAVNSAAALGATLDNWKDIAEMIFDWTHE